jgi:hypothetical protein
MILLTVIISPAIAIADDNRIAINTMTENGYLE